jgi:hypothetical protein
LRPFETVVLLAMALSASGCGRKALSSGVDFKKVRAMGDFYSAYVADHRGQPPKDEQAFREYLTSKQEALQKAGLNVDDMFKSPRGDGLLVWIFGKRPPVSSSGITYFAYEKAPVDGKRLVIGSRGGYEHLDEAQFRKAFPNAS